MGLQKESHELPAKSAVYAEPLPVHRHTLVVSTEQKLQENAQAILVGRSHCLIRWLVALNVKPIAELNYHETISNEYINIYYMHAA